MKAAKPTEYKTLSLLLNDSQLLHSDPLESTILSLLNIKYNYTAAILKEANLIKNHTDAKQITTAHVKLAVASQSDKPLDRDVINTLKQF